VKRWDPTQKMTRDNHPHLQGDKVQVTPPGSPFAPHYWILYEYQPDITKERWMEGMANGTWRRYDDPMEMMRNTGSTGFRQDQVLFWTIMSETGGADPAQWTSEHFKAAYNRMVNTWFLTIQEMKQNAPKGTIMAWFGVTLVENELTKQGCYNWWGENLALCIASGTEPFGMAHYFPPDRLWGDPRTIREQPGDHHLGMNVHGNIPIYVPPGVSAEEALLQPNESLRQCESCGNKGHLKKQCAYLIHTHRTSRYGKSPQLPLGWQPMVKWSDSDPTRYASWHQRKRARALLDTTQSMRINWHDSKASSDYLTIAVANRQTQMLQYEPLTSPRREERIPLEKINEYGPSPKRLKEHAAAVAASNNARIQKEPQSNESRQQPKIQRSVVYRNPQISQDSRKRKVLLRFRQIQKDIPRDILGTANKIYTDGCSFEAMTGWFKKCSKKGRRPIRALRRLYYVDEDQYEPSFCTSLLNVCESLTVEEVPAILSVLALYSDVFAVIQKGYQGSEIDERERVYMPEIKHNVKQCRILKIRYSVMAILGDDKLFDALNQCNHLPHFNVEKTKCLNKADFAIEKWVELIEHCHLTSNSIINESGKKLMRELFGTNVMFQNESVKGINPRLTFLREYRE